MSGGPPHHPHSRQMPSSNAAWNQLQVPNYYPSRQPQHAHMSTDHSLLHQPTWHTPTTEPIKTIPPHSHIFSLEQMLSERQFPHRHQPGVDLTLTKNGNQNGDIITTPISLSVRDTNKINSLPVSALDIQPIEPPIKPNLTSIDLKKKSSTSSSSSSSKRVDSILERLNPNLDKLNNDDDNDKNKNVIIQTNSHDENSNSSSILNVPTPTNRDDDISPYSNDDSLDSNKSRRKRKPSKTIRLQKDEEKYKPKLEEIIKRKTSSESETIDNIAAMVNESLQKNQNDNKETKPISISVIKTKNNIQETITSETSDLSNSSNNVTTTAPKQTTNPQFVEVENKLEEMFAGIEDNNKINQATNDNVTSTSNDLNVKKIMKIKKRHNLDKKKNKKTSKLKKKKIDIIKDIYDSCSNTSSNKSRGPFIQIRGPRDSPLSVNVINTPINDDDNDNKKIKLKKFHDDSEYRHKVKSKGLHCSTLSNQYDSQTKDISWICAFCKRGPHAIDITGPTTNNLSAPGDLFGPYFITNLNYENYLDDPYDKQFKSKKISTTLNNYKLITGNKKKRKFSLDDDDVFLGITATGCGSYEIWAHEECIVWSSGIYLVGPKIIGLEEAVWSSCNVVCVKCHIKGANICCLKRGCVQVVHVCCGKLNSWEFDDENYKTFCPDHRVF